MYVYYYLKISRINKGLSQVQVAKKLNISRQSVSKSENVYNYPDIDNLILLSELYVISIDRLLKKNHG